MINLNIDTIDANEREDHLATLRRDYPGIDWDSGEWYLEDVAQWNDFEDNGIYYFISQLQNQGPTKHFILAGGYSAEGGELREKWEDKEEVHPDFWPGFKREMEAESNPNLC